MCDLDDVPYESDADPETYDPIEARLKRNRSPVGSGRRGGRVRSQRRGRGRSASSSAEKSKAGTSCEANRANSMLQFMGSGTGLQRREALLVYKDKCWSASCMCL